MASLLLLTLLFLPGALLRRGFGVAQGSWGTGTLAVDATLSLAFLCFVFAPLYLLGAELRWALPAVGVATALLSVAAWWSSGQAPAGDSDPTPALESATFALAIALLVPVTLKHAGANVDDWWDLSFVSGWIADGRFRFEPMALTWHPSSDGGPVHPRFLWSVWLMLQTVVSWATGEAAWRFQGTTLAGVVMVLVVSAQAALARVLFGNHRDVALLVPATIAMAVAWIWGSEALPLFTRDYQDKLFAAFVLAPVLLAFLLRTLLAEAVAQDASGPGRGARSAVAAAALATVSVHGLIYTMALFVGGVAVLAVQGRAAWAWVCSQRYVVASLAFAALYPLGQGLGLFLRFGDQGISLATRDNPVVRAHLALNRLIADATPAWIVDPGAVFGPVALLGLIGLGLAWRRSRGDAAARVLLATTVVPLLLMFVPGAAGGAGRLWVPWMLYRLGWMVPVAALLAYTVVTLLRPRESDGTVFPSRWRTTAGLLSMAFVMGLAGQAAQDRLGRGLGEHPGQPGGAPSAAAAAVYEFLLVQDGRAGVLAPPNFSELIPARTGKPVVAFPERGSLVFSGDEERAYARLRDNAQFFDSTATASQRDAVAAAYDVRWAVLPRTLVASGAEEMWLRRYGPQALLAARAGGNAPGDPCSPGGCRTWWSASREEVASGLGPGWSIALETPDYFVVAHPAPWAFVPSPGVVGEPGEASQHGDPSEQVAIADLPRWLRPFALSPVSEEPPHAVVLASITGAPGARVRYSLPPRFVSPTVLPVWTDGPQPWEDAPAEVTISLDWEVECSPVALRILPHLPHDRREVFAIQVDDQHVQRRAFHEKPLFVVLPKGAPRRSVSVRVSSLLGNPVSLADLALVGDPASCAKGWPTRRASTTEMAGTSIVDQLALAGAYPQSARSLVWLGQRAMLRGDSQVAAGLFAAATRRDPTLVEGWVEHGFALDVLAMEAQGDQRKDWQSAANEAFEGGVLADSNSAWAHGCAAWAARRAGHKVSAIWHAWRAAYLDPHYADAWTILAYVLGDLRLRSLSEEALRIAERRDRERNWPALARADLAMQRGDYEAARSALRDWILQHPFDEMARSKLAEVAAAEAGGEQAGAAASHASETP